MKTYTRSNIYTIGTSWTKYSSNFGTRSYVFIQNLGTSTPADRPEIYIFPTSDGIDDPSGYGDTGATLTKLDSYAGDLGASTDIWIKSSIASTNIIITEIGEKR